MKIYDCFTFFNELDLLEIRLNVLYDVVDYFVLVEATTTFQNGPKPLYFIENKQRYEKFLHKIIHIVVDDMPYSLEPFENEYYQRNAISRGLVDCKPEDKIIISDVDEIPDPEAVKLALNLQSPILFNQKLFYYYLNNLCLDFENFPCSSMINFSMFTTAQRLRDKVVEYHVNYKNIDFYSNYFTVVENGGWHFSYQGGADAIVRKLEAYAHDEYNNIEYKDSNKISKLISSGQDLFGRNLTFKKLKINHSFPKYLLHNKEKYSYLILKDDVMLFDQFSRYNGLNKILQILGFDEKTTLLDIGSGPECLMGSVVDSTNITFLDPLITKKESIRIIKGNIFSEKLNNRKFDFVTAIDVLEHIPFAIRNSFIERLSQLTENCIILAFPTSENRPSTQIDESVNENYKKVYGIDYPWLDEHFTYTLPSIAETKAKFEDLGWKCSTIGHGYAPWLEEMMNIVIPTWDCLELHDVLLEMSKTFNESFAEYDFNAPYYREFLIFSKHQLPELSSLVKNIDNEVEVKYQNLVQDTREVLFTESLTTIAKKDKNIQELHKNIQELHKNIQDVSEHLIFQKEEIEKRDTNVLQINHLLEKKQNESMALSDWATSIKEQLDNNSKELETIRSNVWFRVLRKLRLIK